MTGKLYEKKGKYYVVLNIKSPDGNWKKKWISTGLDADKNNQRKAESFLQKTLYEYGKAGDVELTRNNSSDTFDKTSAFSDYVLRWLDTAQSNLHLQHNTFEFYESLCKNHIYPYFVKNNYTLYEITTDILQEFIEYEMKHGNKQNSDSNLSPVTLKRLKTTLNLILNEAVKENRILINPCEFVKIPKLTKKFPAYYNENQLMELFRCIKDEELYPLIYVTVIYGLRRSEVLGLKWDSIDLINKTVTIKHTVVRFSEIIEKDTVKTDSSMRIYPLTQEFENLFLKQKETEKANWKTYGTKYCKNDYVFKHEDGRPYTPDYISRKFNKIVKKYNLPQIRFHDLRHSCASLLVSKGFKLKDIQEWLGHSDIKTTADFYAHLDQDRKIAIANSITVQK